ncbi:type II toxin-antitoxin system VapC family toxin [Microbacterium sp. NEAU-LLC]|uniref:Ribonuclease VapC n=1 Tax=Microbacterium helvum TaxID=2773713 RepID=A0ABR8NNK3_9MICO|nr:type II toxin-antitoxin system VapC family toxin [Microbacterium helvum]MBD3942243.1 type II toxin-antitoxin system VapC family toxin [Microbacterium helvum]
MIVDTSALIAVLEQEAEADDIGMLLAGLGGQISAATLVEARVVALGRGGPTGLRRLDALVAKTGLTVVPFDEIQADVATVAYRDFGRGSGHPAKLNLGDSYSYALAHVADEPLLYIGDDFSHTDIRSALEEYGE